MTLEDISVLFGDPVELSFEQALSKQEHRGEHETTMDEKSRNGNDTVESIPIDK
jgi:hypothetical protein